MCGKVAAAKRIFDRMDGENVVSWNAMIGGFAGAGMNGEAWDCFREMRARDANQTKCNLSSPWLEEAVGREEAGEGHIAPAEWSGLSPPARVKDVCDNKNSRSERVTM
ncbi:hypothetical protein E2562_011121, partial [Oryza meyeriana var. granulata]